LTRVIHGDAALDADQISKLALLANVEIAELFTGTGWTSSSKHGIHTFKNDEYMAELDTETWIVRVFHRETLFHTSILFNSSAPLSLFFSEIEKIINNYKTRP